MIRRRYKRIRGASYGVCVCGGRCNDLCTVLNGGSIICRFFYMFVIVP